MAASKFRGVLKRRLKLVQVVAPVNVYITERGVEFSVVGKKKRLSTKWGDIVRICDTPADSPAHLAGLPLAFLNAQGIGKRDQD